MTDTTPVPLPSPSAERLRELDAEWRRQYKLIESLASVPVRLRDYKRLANAIQDCKAAKKAYEAEKAILAGERA